MPYLGFGLRLRREYLAPVLETHPPVDWLELIPESYFEGDASLYRQLDQLCDNYPLVLHGISLAIGSPWPLDLNYLDRLKELSERLQPAWVSDHLCWSGADDIQGRLLPLPYSEETLDHVVGRIQQVQEALGRQILLENVPLETRTGHSEIPEAEFIARVAERSDSFILLDIANLQTTSMYQGFDPMAYLLQLPEPRVQQIHLAGAVALCDAQDPGGESAADPIWELYTGALGHFGPVSTMIERVDTIPPLEEMVKEVEKARCSARQYLSQE
jgi:uncharacterized protein (UPF0276 family)